MNSNRKQVNAASQDQLELIEQKDAGYSNESGSNPPLIRAAQDGRVEVVQDLLKNNAEINERSKDGRTALMYAVSVSEGTEDRFEDYLCITKFLILSGININAADKDNKTALMYAIKAKNFHAIELLINSNAKVDVADKYGNTPLIMAALSSSDRQSVKLCVHWIEELIKKGADIDSQNHAGENPLIIAAKHNNKIIVEYLVHSKANINIRDNAGYSALLHTSSEDIAIFLIQCGADINIISKKGKTALSIATDLGYKKVIELLFSLNIKKEIINIKTQGFGLWDGVTPLGCAAERIIDHAYNPKRSANYRDIAILLLKGGADPHIVCDGRTAFNFLSNNRSGDREIMELLLPFKSRVTREDDSQAISLLPK